MLGWLVLLFFVTIIVLLASAEEQPTHWRPKGFGRCQGCAYDLAGLPAEAPCPECGRESPGAPVPRVGRTVLRPLVCRRVGFTICMGTLAAATMAPVIHLAHVLSYVLQLKGYRPDVIASAMRARGWDLAWEPAMAPLLVVIAGCMVFSLAQEGAPYSRIAWRAIAGAWLVSAAWLALATVVEYG